jgi:hypothetical protein
MTQIEGIGRKDSFPRGSGKEISQLVACLSTGYATNDRTTTVGVHDSTITLLFPVHSLADSPPILRPDLGLLNNIHGKKTCPALRQFGIAIVNPNTLHPATTSNDYVRPFVSLATISYSKSDRERNSAVNITGIPRVVTQSYLACRPHRQAKPFI